MIARTLLPAGVLVLLLLLAAAARQEGAGRDAERPIHERIDLPSIAACGGCHPEVYEEWAASLHHRAWTNDNIQAATRGFEIESCRKCHSPMPVIPNGLGKPPLYRDFNQIDGVHCLSCHGLEHGVAAARTVEDAPCKPVFEPRLLHVDSCYPCHEPTHQAYEEFYRSDAFALGLRCVDCHMPPRGDRPGRYHGPTGGFEPEFVKRALAWSAAFEGDELVLELRNRAAHKFPGEIPSRSFLVRVEPEGHEPIELLYRKPNKGEERADDRLEPDERRVLRFPLPAGCESVRVRLLFLPLPLMGPDDGFLLGEWTGRPGG